jgi:hypothetical protein
MNQKAATKPDNNSGNPLAQPAIPVILTRLNKQPADISRSGCLKSLKRNDNHHA